MKNRSDYLNDKQALPFGHRTYPTRKEDIMHVWFITGASRGFGALIAKEALAAGDAVVATARHPQSVEGDLGARPRLVPRWGRLYAGRPGPGCHSGGRRALWPYRRAAQQCRVRAARRRR